MADNPNATPAPAEDDSVHPVVQILLHVIAALILANIAAALSWLLCWQIAQISQI